MLALPIIVRPLLLFFDRYGSISVDASLGLSTSLLLIVVVVVDSLLTGVSSVRLLFFHTLWIGCGFLVASIAWSFQQGLFFLGLFFSLHALRSAIPLWCGNRAWWYWPAWIRDAATAVVLFGWAFLTLP